MGTREKYITVCICTYNNHCMLYDSMQSLVKQSVSSELYDVIILDNSTKLTHPLYDKCKLFASRQGNFKYITRPATGLSDARNMCVTECKTELIHFIDDDALAHVDLVENAIGCFSGNINLSVMGGKVLPNWSQSPRPTWLSDDALGYLSMLDLGSSELIYSESEGMWLAGANICFRKKVLENCGGFSTNLGRNGSHGGLLGAEEMELIYALKDSHTIMYSPRCVVDHIVQPSRLTQSWFVKRVSWQAATDVMTNVSYLENPGYWSNNKPGGEFIKESMHLLFRESKTPGEFSEKLKVAKLLAFWMLNDFKM